MSPNVGHKGGSVKRCLRDRIKDGVNGCVGLVIFFLGVNAGAFAAVYQCQKENGHVEFRDTPCSTSLDTQTFLPQGQSKTDPKVVKAEEKEVKVLIKKQERQQGKTTRLHSQAVKKREKDIGKEERRSVRCARLQEKIAVLENQLKQGHKLKRYKRLQAQLEHAELMNKRYCKAQ